MLPTDKSVNVTFGLICCLTTGAHWGMFNKMGGVLEVLNYWGKRLNLMTLILYYWKLKSGFADHFCVAILRSQLDYFVVSRSETNDPDTHPFVFRSRGMTL